MSLTTAAFSLGGCSESINQFSKGKNKPNILLILVDDLGYGDLSSYGAKDLQTPNIDSLMKQGCRLDSFYANCPVCSPTRAALLSGRYPDLVGVPGVIRNRPQDTFGYLNPGTVLLPKVLKSAGYDTAIIGKWHLGLHSPNTPNEKGFDHFHGFLGDMMDDYFHHRGGGKNWMRLNKNQIDPKGHATDLFTDWSVDYINKRTKKNKPFFLYLAYNAPHIPIQSPKGWFERVKRRQKNITNKRASIVAMIEHLDDGIGKVINTLKETGQADNTLIIFTSDNGGQRSAGASNGELNGNKGEMLEGGIRVPFCVVWPGKIKPVRDHGFVALTMDLYPTICQAVSARFDHEIDGISILPALMGEPVPKQNRFLFWMRREGWDRNGQIYYCARYEDYKLLQRNSPFEKLKLYNLKDDPKEQNSLSKDHPMYKRLFRALQRHIIKAGAVPWHEGLD